MITSSQVSNIFKLQKALVIILIIQSLSSCKRDDLVNSKKHIVNVKVTDELTSLPLKNASISLSIQVSSSDTKIFFSGSTNENGVVQIVLDDLDKLLSFKGVKSADKLSGDASVNCLLSNNPDTNPAYYNYYIGWNCYSHVTYGPIGYSHSKKIELSAIESNVAFTLKPLTAFKFEYKKTSVGDKYVILNFDCLTTDCNVFSSGIPRQGYGTIFNYNKGLGVNFSGIVEETKQDYITKNNDNIKLKSYTNSTIQIDYSVFDNGTNQKLYNKQDTMKLVNGAPLMYTIEY
jgi:hypothetical protein